MNDLFDVQDDPNHSEIFAAYKEWDELNPHFYELFCRFARQLADRGYRHVGVALLFERIRWESMIRTQGDDFKLNNNFRSIYARRFMKEHPQYQGFFRVRELRSLSEAEVKAA